MHLVRRTIRIWLMLPGTASWILATVLFVPGSLPVHAQNPVQPSPVVQATEPTPKPTAKLTPKEEAREAKIAADAEKLYQMALDLKVEVDKSNKDTVSLSVAKRAAELEKLSKLLKQEMRAN